MKAKRLTALALAALMAASTTSVALAGERVDADLDFANDGYYKYNSDTNRLESAARDEFQPGDDVYLRLKEDPSDTFSNKKTYNAYADWTIGDSWVKDIDVVYRKGDVTTSTSTENYYSITGVGTLLGWNVSSTKTSETQDNLKNQLRSDSHFTNAVSKYVTDNYPTKSGYKLKTDGTFKEQLSDFGITSSSKNGFFYKDTFYENVTAAGLEAISESSTYRTDKLYFKNLADTLAYFDFTEYNGSPTDTAVYVEASVSGNWGKASISQDDTYTQTANTAGLSDFATVKLGEQLYWVKNANVVDFIKSVGVGAASLQTVAGGESATYYYDQNSVANNKNKGYDLVNASDVQSSSITVHTYQGKDYKTEAEAKTAANVEDYNGPVEVAKGKVIESGAANTAATAAVNADLDKSVKYESKTVTNTQPQYEYWVKISTKDSNTTKDIDVVGSIWVGTSKSSAKKEKDNSEDRFRADFTLTNSDPDNNDYDEATDYVSIEPGERAVVSFADDASDEFEVEFGDDARFVFNARGQGKLNLAYNTKYNKDFAYDYDDANIDFITFEGEPTTNRTGTLYIYADKDTYIYEVTDRGAKSVAYLPAGGTGAVNARVAAGKINGAYYDKDEEAWVIRTRHLTSYAISDKKLKTVDQMENGSSSSSGSNSGSTSGSGSNNGKPNPDTGR